MNSEFLTYFRLGVGHIADLRGYDHILFIVALTAGYALRDWRRLLWLVTAFTAGHSITLALATLDLVRVHAPTIELLIPVTIVVTAGYSMLARRQSEASGEAYAPERHALLYGLAGCFGLIHGLGFSNFLRAILGEESIVLPLFAFNVGLEIGQLAIVAVVLLAGTLACDVAGVARRRWATALSLVIVLAGIRMIVERLPQHLTMRLINLVFPSSRLLVFLALCASATTASAQNWLNSKDKKTNQSSFRAIDEWPDPNEYRNAAGAPGPKYWQQRVDYAIKATLDTVTHSVTGSERVTYHNNSPDQLSYIWFQLDQNIDRADSRASLVQQALPSRIPEQARRFLAPEAFEGGYNLSRVQVVDARGIKSNARYVINGTVMKVHLAAPIASGQRAVIEIDWTNKVPEGGHNGRGAKELVKDGWLYELAQWFPRASVYDDVNGWATDQFLGQGEFYLNFGTYDVEVTVPRNHIVNATGVLTNPAQVLTLTQQQRLAKAWTSDKPVFIVAPDEVMKPEARPAGTTPLTWKFHAENVRDFAWVSSKTYVWDAMGFKYRPTDKTIELHSLYPRDAMPLWDSVSTKAIAQTMKTYGRMSFEYPYPKAVNVHGPVFGMEYPMIAFCGARPTPDGKVSPGLARALISVTIHEVGHNWFPMIVASDERKWTWMDEGINSFLQYYAEKDWDPNYPSQRGPAKNIVGYMKQDAQVPLMTESNDIQAQFGNNGYSKPAAGLVMLREQVLGDSLFDESFKEYSRKWMFKHPQPADFFRSIEDGAGEQLNYFWRGWFYTTYANDQSIASVESQAGDSLLGPTKAGQTYYRVKIENKGGLVLPLQIEVTYDDGTTELVKLPADVWRRNELSFTYGFFSKKTVTQVVLDPKEALADVDRSNNTWKKPNTVS